MGGTGFGDFPTIAGIFDTTSGGLADVFVAKFARGELGTRSRCPEGYLAFTDGSDVLPALS